MPPDPVAEAIAVDGLLQVLAERAPDLVSQAKALSPSVWIDIATGRQSCSGDLAATVPVMS